MKMIFVASVQIRSSVTGGSLLPVCLRTLYISVSFLKDVVD